MLGISETAKPLQFPAQLELPMQPLERLRLPIIFQVPEHP